MAGTLGTFNAANFRDKIHFVMNMGLPVPEEEQPVFFFPSTTAYNKGTDQGNLPFDPTATKTVPAPVSVKVPCAIEFRDAQNEQTNFGDLDAVVCAVTFLDEDYAQVQGCEFMVLRGEKYSYEHTAQPLGLFDVGVYTLIFRAVDST